MQLCLFEDRHFSNFLPLVYFRPVYALRCGATKLREKIERLFPKASIVYHCRPELAGYLREHHPDKTISTLKDEPTWFVNGRVLVDEHFHNILKTVPKNDTAFVNGDDVVAAFASRGVDEARKKRLSSDCLSEDFFKGFAKKEIQATMLTYLWELVHRNGEEIGKDFVFYSRKGKNKKNREKHSSAHLLNEKDIVIGKGTVVKPGVVLDAEHGPIIIGENVILSPNAVIEGPAFIGYGSVVKVGAKIYANTTIGEVCKVGGEIDASTIHSYSNKQHDGFLGHSYLGSWVNIGADTNNSDLKNNYGSVEVMVNGDVIDTKQQFVGLFMGDHSKTGINVMFDTGTVIGVSCNLYGSGLPPKYLPSFSWGNIASSFATYKLEKSIDTARRVMARRNVPWTTAYEKLFRSVFDATTGERTRLRIF
jgi:UDP-N-acetylglucosamine diphosphorylase/glucosamine-1-phosphate N-acetyltransferase